MGDVFGSEDVVEVVRIFSQDVGLKHLDDVSLNAPPLRPLLGGGVVGIGEPDGDLSHGSSDASALSLYAEGAPKSSLP